MKPKQPKFAPGLRINILLFDAFSNMLLACLLEPLRVVRDDGLAKVDWVILTHANRPLRSSSGLAIVADKPIAKAPFCDLLLVIGGDTFRRDANDPELRQSLALVRNAGAVIAADTGPWLLARAGYLSGRRCTLHWQLLGEFSETFPDVVAVPELHVRDGRWMTCGGAASALNLILEEIGLRLGPAARFDAASMFLYDPAHGSAAELPFGGVLAHPNPRIRRIIGYMAARIEEPMTLVEIARASGMTVRSMVRLFGTEMKTTPGRYYLNLRLARARELAADNTRSLAEIAPLCGFSCASALTRAHKRVYRHGVR